ncbi:MAG: alpha/beta hydrolase [Acidobacteriota bacterium]
MVIHRRVRHGRRRVTRTAPWTIAAGLGCLLAGACSGADDQKGSIDGLVARFVDVEGVQTRYYDYGQGEPIVMVHGGGMGGASTANNFSRNIPGLATRFRVLAVDRLAQGMTGNPKDDEDFSTQGAVKHVYLFIQTLKLDKVHLVGHSSGGGVVLGLAVEHPEIVKTLTLTAYGAGLSTGEGPRKFEAILAKCPPDTNSYEHRKCRLLALAHSETTFPPDYEAADEYMGGLPKSEETRKRMAALREARPDLEDRNERYRKQALEQARAGALQMPILLLAGKQDTLGWSAADPHSMQRRQMELFSIVGAKNQRVTLRIINEAGHFPYREHPEQWNAALMHFIGFWNSHPLSVPGAEGSGPEVKTGGFMLKEDGNDAPEKLR